MMRTIERLTVAALLAAPASLRAHSFGHSYSLPVPIWLYLYGAAAALIASFVVVGFFVNVKTADANERTVLLDGYSLFRQLHRPSVLASLRAVSVFSLLLCLMTGLFGKDSAYPLRPLFCITHFNPLKLTLTISSSWLFGCGWVGVIECIFGKLTYLLGTLIRFGKSACASSKFWPSLRCRCGVFDTSTNFRVFTCIFV